MTKRKQKKTLTPPPPRLSKKKNSKTQNLKTPNQEINKIFLLIRSKKSVNRDDGSETRLTAQQRLDAFVDSSALFDSLRVQQEGGGEKGGRHPRGVFEFGSGRG